MTTHFSAATRRLSNRFSDKMFDRTSVLILSIWMLAIIYPIYFIIIASVSEPSAVYNGNVWFAPSGFTLEGYQRIFSDPTIIHGFLNSVFYLSLIHI